MRCLPIFSLLLLTMCHPPAVMNKWELPRRSEHTLARQVERIDESIRREEAGRKRSAKRLERLKERKAAAVIELVERRLARFNSGELRENSPLEVEREMLLTIIREKGAHSARAELLTDQILRAITSRSSVE